MIRKSSLEDKSLSVAGGAPDTISQLILLPNFNLNEKPRQWVKRVPCTAKHMVALPLQLWQ
jgi:hypothetical protein